MNQALEQEFREKTLSKEQAAALVQSGQGVYIGCCTSYARAIADAIAAGSALITMSQSSLRLNNSNNCVRRELSLRVDDMMTPFRFPCEVRLAPSANFFQ